MTIALILIIMLLPQFWAILAQRSAALMVLLLCASLCVMLVVLFTAPLLLWGKGADGGPYYHDTYYVVAHTRYLVWMVAMLAGLAALLGLAQRMAGPLPRITAPLAILFAICATYMMFHPVLEHNTLGVPRRFRDSTGWVEFANAAERILSLVAAAAYLALACIALFALIRRLLTSRSSG